MPKSSPRPNPDEEWESLLRHWQDRQPAQPRPFFYSRVRARLTGEMLAERPPLPACLRWPSYAAMLGIVLLLSGDGAVLPSGSPANPAKPYPSDQPAAQYPR